MALGKGTMFVIIMARDPWFRSLNFRELWTSFPSIHISTSIRLQFKKNSDCLSIVWTIGIGFKDVLLGWKSITTDLLCRNFCSSLYLWVSWTHGIVNFSVMGRFNSCEQFFIFWSIKSISASFLEVNIFFWAYIPVLVGQRFNWCLSNTFC